MDNPCSWYRIFQISGYTLPSFFLLIINNWCNIASNIFAGIYITSSIYKCKAFWRIIFYVFPATLFHLLYTCELLFAHRQELFYCYLHYFLWVLPRNNYFSCVPPSKARLTLKKMWNASRFCMSSLLRGHANLLCIVPILVYVLPRQVALALAAISADRWKVGKLKWK